MKNIPIHMRFLVLAVVLIGAVTFTLGMVTMMTTTRFMYERFENRIAFLAHYLALNSEVGVLLKDRSGLESLAHNLLGEIDVARVAILDASDGMLVDLSRPVQGSLSMVEVPVMYKKANEENVLFNDYRNIKENPFARIPQIFEERIGNVQIFFSTNSIDQLNVYITKRFIWFSMGLGLLACAMFFLVSRRIGTELKQLTVTATQIGRGDFDLRVRPGNLPETRALAISFNAMLDSLKKSQVALQTVSREMMRQKALAEMGKFSLMIAHEIKNPLAIMKSSLDVLSKSITDENDTLMIEYIEDEIVRLNRLIESFLQFAKPAKPNFQIADVNQLITGVVERFQLLHINDPFDIKLNTSGQEAICRVDVDLMSRCLGNIIENACQATGNGRDIEVNTMVDSPANTWQVRIADQGEGVDPANIDKIFEPFYTTRSKGTGLGLAFAAQVVKSHFGTIHVQNRTPLNGAVFTIEIPMGDGYLREPSPQHKTLPADSALTSETIHGADIDCR